MNLLFICSRNKQRSLTAEKLFDGRNGHRAFSAGTETGACVKVTDGMIARADIIFCMEKKHVRRVRERAAAAGKRLICLNIPDEYDYMDEELCVLLESAVGKYLEEL